GAVSATDAQGNPAVIVGDKGDNGWWRGSGTFKVAYDLDDDSKAAFSFMRSEYEYNYGDPHTYLRDAPGNPVWSGTLNSNGNRFSLYEYNFLSSGGGRTDNIYHLDYNTRIFSDALLKVSCGLIDVEGNWYVTPGSTRATTRSGGPGKINETPSQSFQSDLQVSIPILEKHVLTTGVAFRYDHANTEEHSLSDWRDRRSKGSLSYESEGKDNIFSVYTQAEIALLTNLTAYLGVRGDYWEAYDGSVNQVGSTGYPREFDSKNSFAVSPKAALVYKPLDTTTLRGSVGQSFRPPNVYELYRTWVSGTVTYASNPDLDPETCFSWDLGVEQKLGEKALLRLTYFENTLRDLIYRLDVSPTLKESINAGKAETYGLEIGYEHKVTDWMKLFGSYTYTSSEMLENPAKPSTVGKRLTGVPENMFNIGGEFTGGPFSLTATGRYVDKQYNNDENTDTASGVPNVYDSFFVADVSLRWKVKPWATLVFSVDNVFDEHYFSYYQSPGRKFFGGLTMKF
ncbi:MAG: TonB-dependent receptor, partial [Syntrophobacteraceae bacterium]